MTRREIGNFGETVVCNYLTQQGYDIVKRNYCIRGGEIDIIAIKSDFICFVEVKTRKENSMVSGLEAVTRKKQLRISGLPKDICLKVSQNYSRGLTWRKLFCGITRLFPFNI